MVGAASIVAKVARDAWVRSFIDRTEIDIGSFYERPEIETGTP